MKYPIGPQTIKKAAQTEPGKLAALLSQVLYSADHQKVPLEGSDILVKRWVCHPEIFKGNNSMPKNVPTCGGKDRYFETEVLMRAIRDYLEFRSFEEVIP